MRTVEEVVAKCRDPKWGDLFGTRIGDLIEWLPFDRAKEWLKDTATPEAWSQADYPRSLAPDAIIDKIRDYMPFAWDKANDCRGLSAGRSIYHMQAWLWLLGVDDATIVSLEDYDYYGKPQLRGICEALNIDWRALDDGRWRDDEEERGREPQAAVVIKLPDSVARLFTAAA